MNRTKVDNQTEINNTIERRPILDTCTSGVLDRTKVDKHTNYWINVILWWYNLNKGRQSTKLNNIIERRSILVLACSGVLDRTKVDMHTNYRINLKFRWFKSNKGRWSTNNNNNYGDINNQPLCLDWLLSTNRLNRQPWWNTDDEMLVL